MISHNVSGESFQQFSNKPCSDVVTVSVHQCDRAGEVSEVSVLIGLTDLHFPFHCILWFKWWVGGSHFFSGIPIVP